MSDQSPVDQSPVDQSKADLRAAWDDLIAHLQAARDAVDTPELHAPPATVRGLAEGYRYLVGFAFSAFERAFAEDPDRPTFRRAIQPMDKATIDNADALYLSAPVDGSRSYRITGRFAGQAPQYLIVEAHDSYAGDSGSIMELMPGGRTITGVLDTADLEVDDDRFEILVAPERPDGHLGNFLCSRELREDGTEVISTYVIVRVLFHDWEHEVAPELTITALDPATAAPDPLDPAAASARLRRAGVIAENQMKFWTQFYDFVLGAYGEGNPDAPAYQPRNDLNAPTNAQLSTGGGQSTNVYSGGLFVLDPDEALIIEMTTPVTPDYQGMHLSNLWGESLDYAHHVVSLNGFQEERDADGVTRFVVAHNDPGVPNWLDTTGQREGFVTFRWTYHQSPEQMPVHKATKVRLEEVRKHLPDSTRWVTSEERAAQVAIRREHVQRRYRQH
ncbi:hypothetical protein F0U44_06950 [Nocardioides humilatus]|uniref:DUF1214 domain-containing protein n=1 Tax=Nocardioides humilatus TaxID=2607660 RepID=A0A5B1LHN2_9ACTN|nr:hypothetical protein [Nocardioides humilatus]KAA1420162.1 hypothetical protein F0U44_06950 [Nocardioides humilatus]